jgi:hypothetical protein
MKALDLTGQRFGQLTVLSLAEYKGIRSWVCQCDCGNTKVYPTSQLTQGRVKSCGCLQHEDLTGQKFGRLTALRRIDNAGGRTRYEVVCECGNTREVIGSQWKRGHVRSCGCIQQENLRSGKYHRLPDGVALRNSVMASYRDHARKRGVPFALAPAQMIDLLAGRCHYCGTSPSTTKTDPKRGVSFTYNGIDRKDNMQGYVPENVVSCCQVCNYKKGAQHYDDFLAWIARVRQHRIALREQEPPPTTNDRE